MLYCIWSIQYQTESKGEHLSAQCDTEHLHITLETSDLVPRPKKRKLENREDKFDRKYETYSSTEHITSFVY